MGSYIYKIRKKYRHCRDVGQANIVVSLNDTPTCVYMVFNEHNYCKKCTVLSTRLKRGAYRACRLVYVVCLGVWVLVVKKTTTTTHSLSTAPQYSHITSMAFCLSNPS